MRIDDILTSHSWVLIVAAGTALAGTVAVIANVLKSLESFDNLKRKKQKPAPGESKPVEVRLDLKDVGIIPFKTAAQPIRDMALGGVLGAMGAEAVDTATHAHDPTSQSSHDDASPHAETVESSSGMDSPSSHSASGAGTRHTDPDRADSLNDWIGDLFS